MKYTTPSIEVVNFNSSDAPRIGMQWFYMNSPTAYVPIPAGFGFNGPVNLPTDVYNGRDLTAYGVDCSSVTFYHCKGEVLPSDAYEGNYNGITYVNVTDDGKSC